MDDGSKSDEDATPKKARGYQIKGGRVGFVQIPTAVVADPDLSNGAFRLFSLLVAYARQEDETFVGQAVLGEALGVTERQVRSLMAELKDAGLVLVENRGARNTNIMRLAGDEDIRALYAGSLGSELPRKKPSHAQNDLSTGTRVPPLVAVPEEGQSETEPMHSSTHKEEEQPDAAVLPMRTRGGDRKKTSGPTGRKLPVRREVEAENKKQEVPLLDERTSSTSSDLVDEEASTHTEDAKKINIEYVVNDDFDVKVLIGPRTFQDSLKSAGLLEEVTEIAYLAKSIQTHIREQVLEMVFVDGLTIEKQVERFREAVLDVKNGRW